jgi:hypothetical protein
MQGRRQVYRHQNGERRQSGQDYSRRCKPRASPAGRRLDIARIAAEDQPDVVRAPFRHNRRKRKVIPLRARWLFGDLVILCAELAGLGLYAPDMLVETFQQLPRFF